MKVGLNATCFNDRPSGAKQRFVGIYGELVRRLPDVEFVVYEPEASRVSSWFHGAPNVFAKRTPLPSEGRTRKFIGGFRYWGSALSGEGLDLFEMFNLPLVKAPAGQTLLTIHDIRGLHPEYNAFQRAVFKSTLVRAMREADIVVTVSEAMKEEIVGFYPSAKVEVIYNGLAASEFGLVSDSALRAFCLRYDLAEGFVLAVGHIERRKNYHCLVEAIAQLRDMGRSCYLVIIGNDSGERKAIEEKVEKLNLTGYVKILSGLSDLEVRCAYKACSLFVFPSSYEGFGIPILEAMAANRPMVLSDIPVFREITQDNGVYFPHNDVESMADSIECVLSSSSERERLVEYGNKRVQAFSFQNLAAQVADLYESLMQRS